MARTRIPGFTGVRVQPTTPVRNQSRGRQRLFEYGPATGNGTPGTIPRITTSNLRKGIGNSGTRRRRVDPAVKLGLGTTTKSILRKKVLKGIRQPGYVTPNYQSPLD
jgi:hypothetical protein